MNKLDMLFKKQPPRRPLKSLEAIVDDWSYRFGKDAPENHRRDHVVDFCKSAPSLKIAIERACASRAANGKMHNHQCKVREVDRKQFASLITDALRDVELHDFDELHDLLEKWAPSGIGPVTIYDVATRVGAYLKLEPESRYLHAGVRVGWSKLFGYCSPAIARIPRTALPAPLRTLPTDEVEDLLCAYRDYLSPWSPNMPTMPKKAKAPPKSKPKTTPKPEAPKGPSTNYSRLLNAMATWNK
jgi:hypothetical protein